MSGSTAHPHSLEQLPKARIEKRWTTWLIWLAPIGAAALAAWFLYSEFVKGGPTIEIYFENAAGLQVGKSQVRYRGAQIGSVKAVSLTRDHREVKVTAALDGDAAGIARQGSLFWIVKPEIGLEKIRGLRTIMSGDFITVQPGHGKPQTKFQGLPQPPVIEPPGTLSILLLAEKIGSLHKRSPVFYRGIQVGEVFDCDLGPTSQTIRITVHIQKHYAPLVRLDSRFWNAGGLNVALGLNGLDISAESAQTLISGGVAFATPDASAKQAPAGTAFRLYDKPQDQWLGWAPSIPLESSNQEHSVPAPAGRPGLQ